ncbi:hypothetical protein ADL12_36385 [Streptomyces regalis]|uniref:Uncharacterized protein n=1 Tax=Streptomyces regalis TaxID=68262 RepID=A0A101JD42_9ACTN|nr:hypothetical protein ADL12_36385 [Streptomyces regalis]
MPLRGEVAHAEALVGVLRAECRMWESNVGGLVPVTVYPAAALGATVRVGPVAVLRLGGQAQEVVPLVGCGEGEPGALGACGLGEFTRTCDGIGRPENGNRLLCLRPIASYRSARCPVACLDADPVRRTVASSPGSSGAGSRRVTGRHPKWATATRRLSTDAPTERCRARPVESA